MRRASWMSLGMMVTRLAWMAQRLVSSKRPTRYASAASWSASTAWLWNRRSVLKSWAISRTRRWNGSLRMSSSVLFWYLRISRSATVPGL
uniref:Secreted protein n=1 Tax=Triticum urartu TaxID=4572 RepID=A0A8R7QW43_TRIUA